MKKKNYSVSDKPKREERGNLRYLKRLAQDAEATEEIDEYEEEQEDDVRDDGIQNKIW